MSNSHDELDARISDPESASRLLRLALQPSVQSADLMIEYALSQRDTRWVDAAFRGVGAALPGEAIPTSSELRSWREKAKLRFDQGSTFDERAGALFVYAWCVAASIVHFGSTGSSQRRDVIDGLLGAAASIAPSALRPMIEAAITKEAAD
ncbi:MAG: hypothetical protein RL354_305 [Planctomycetota bacterium]